MLINKFVYIKIKQLVQAIKFISHYWFNELGFSTKKEKQNANFNNSNNNESFQTYGNFNSLLGKFDWCYKFKVYATSNPHPPWFKILNMATGFHIEVTDSSNNEFPSLISTNMFISTNTITNSLNVTIKFCTNHALKIMCLIFWTW